MDAEDPVVVATLLALAGVRTGDAVTSAGTGGRVVRGLLAMSRTADEVEVEARVAVAGGSSYVPVVAARLGDGGRLVGLAADEATARGDGAAAGVGLQHVVAVDGGVAWSGRRQAGAQPPA